MALVSVREVCFGYGGQYLLDKVSLQVERGERVGLVGRNGSGKSSFLRIVAGDERPDTGTVSRKQGLVVGYLPQEFQLDDSATVDANIRSGAADLIAARSTPSAIRPSKLG